MEENKALTEKKSQAVDTRRARRISRGMALVAGAGVGVLFLPTSFSVLLGAGLIAAGIIFSILFAVRAASEIQPTQESPYDKLRQQIGRLRLMENIEREGERLLNLFQQARDRHKSFERILSERLNPEEITFARYWGAAADAHQAVMSQMQDLSARLVVRSGFSLKDLQQQLSKLPMDSKEHQAIRERLEYGEKLNVEISELFANVERGLTELDRVTFALSEMKTGSALKDEEIEAIFSELKVLAERASKYSKV